MTKMLSFLRQDTDELRKQIFENVCFVFIDDTRRDKYVVGLSDIQKMHHIYHHMGSVCVQLANPTID